ncbi:MAG: hypothetical protein HYR55_00595 [Acidobacteria bacterium]|nr:hypothetical protein [Acidobacteriota bacterium]MBI3655096.1 hypothetical protein [Acidobacteriota bacterium]
MSKWFLISILILSLGFVVGHAQSLADLAKAERERQKKLKSNPVTRTKVITERDLRKTNSAAQRNGMSADPKESSDDRNRSDLLSKPSLSTGLTDHNGRNESYWRQRKATLQKELDQVEQGIKEIDDFLGRHHATYTLQSLAPMKNKREEKAKQAEAIRQKMKELEDEARRAGAPPAWLR